MTVCAKEVEDGQFVWMMQVTLQKIKMPDHTQSYKTVQRWRERLLRIVIDIPARFRQHIPIHRPPLFYADEPVVLRSFEDTPQAALERTERLAWYPIYDPPYEVINLEGDIRPLSGYEAWKQEQDEARAQWEKEFPPIDEEEYEEVESEEEDHEKEEEEEEVNEPLVLPYPEDNEDFDFFRIMIF
ncbi:unnamed protein product [Bemisia tabaci]|uniref:Uncharacterized protein n=1 Tax=Bemisia tabaci TaxID=7038 RepID=A0A9P0AHN6_BEMTA|nr:unnamed protein product [Bemisia tabaci]